MWETLLAVPCCQRAMEVVWKGEKKPSREDLFKAICQTCHQEFEFNGEYTKPHWSREKCTIEWTEIDEIEGDPVELRKV